MCTDMVHQLSKISTRTVHGKDEHADMCGQRADICTDRQSTDSLWLSKISQGKDQRADMCTDAQPQSQSTWAKITRTVHGKGQRAESKDQRADMCTDGQPQTSSTDVLCVLADTHGRPVCAGGHPRTSCVCWRTPTDVLCVLNRQPTWAKITRSVHGRGQRAEYKDQRADLGTDGQPRTSFHMKGQHAESKDQRADMCTDGQPQTSSTDVLCVLTDTHGRPVCADGNPHTFSHVGQNHPNSPWEGPAC
ncbi:unnamed protein product [Brassica rapa]|uniref:Uncharacterized protein n=1 Tax=Brassica campestris TaxID=3711 RepID=A0A8D9CTT8_BRACM|nr:unnamed protein product [Brassica rapa]